MRELPGKLFEGDLRKDDDRGWVIEFEDESHSIEEALEAYEGKEVRLTLIEIKELEELQGMLAQHQEQE